DEARYRERLGLAHQHTPVFHTPVQLVNVVGGENEGAARTVQRSLQTSLRCFTKAVYLVKDVIVLTAGIK
ncbi:MAG: hypothetical protein ACKO3Q_11385, partial [Betaproteobacteria bacterium]